MWDGHISQYTGCQRPLDEARTENPPINAHKAWCQSHDVIGLTRVVDINLYVDNIPLQADDGQ
jgi:hypothetical protein